MLRRVAMLFDETGFTGFPRDGFEVFSIAHREERRRAIVETFHPALTELGRILVRRLDRLAGKPLHAHLPQLNWPPGYQPFCTWLALSYEAHGYQSDAQLNVGVHADHVSVRLGWDTRPALFGRFEFLCRHGSLDDALRELTGEHGMRIRVYASAPWPEGSRLCFETENDIGGSFDEVRLRGVWWEIGHRFDLPAQAATVAAPTFADRATETLGALCPLYGRIHGG